MLKLRLDIPYVFLYLLKKEKRLLYLLVMVNMCQELRLFFSFDNFFWEIAISFLQMILEY